MVERSGMKIGQLVAVRSNTKNGREDSLVYKIPCNEWASYWLCSVQLHGSRTKINLQHLYLYLYLHYRCRAIHNKNVTITALSHKGIKTCGQITQIMGKILKWNAQRYWCSRAQLTFTGRHLHSSENRAQHVQSIDATYRKYQQAASCRELVLGTRSVASQPPSSVWGDSIARPVACSSPVCRDTSQTGSTVSRVRHAKLLFQQHFTFGDLRWPQHWLGPKITQVKKCIPCSFLFNSVYRLAILCAVFYIRLWANEPRLTDQ